MTVLLSSLLDASTRSPTKVVELANIVLGNVPTRLNARVKAFQALPYIVGTNPYIARALDGFRRSAETITAIAAQGPVRDLAGNARLAVALEQLVHSHANDVPTLAKGFQQCSRYMSQDDIALFLDNAIRSRIAVRLLCEQHVAVSRALRLPESQLHDDDLGIVNMRCSPADMVRSCASFVAEMCEATVGASPTCVADGDVQTTFAYIPVHMEYILTELLKNAYRASVEHHLRSHCSGPVPPVLVTISHPSTTSPAGLTSHVSIRIRDQGGGVAHADLDRIFSYAFTTAGRTGSSESGADIRDDDDSDGGPYAAQHIGGIASLGHDGDSGVGSGNVFGDITGKGMQVGAGTLAGLGYGLPLARLYATFFGGSLELKSLHGHGVDVFLKLRNLHPQLGEIEI